MKFVSLRGGDDGQHDDGRFLEGSRIFAMQVHFSLVQNHLTEFRLSRMETLYGMCRDYARYCCNANTFVSAILRPVKEVRF